MAKGRSVKYVRTVHPTIIMVVSIAMCALVILNVLVLHTPPAVGMVLGLAVFLLGLYSIVAILPERNRSDRKDE